MDWQKCKSYGLIEVRPQSNCVFLYYNQWNYSLISSPNLYMVMESAMWQGDSLIIKGTDQGGNKRIYLYNGFNNFQQIL